MTTLPYQEGIGFITGGILVIFALKSLLNKPNTHLKTNLVIILCGLVLAATDLLPFYMEYSKKTLKSPAHTKETNATTNIQIQK